MRASPCKTPPANRRTGTENPYLHQSAIAAFVYAADFVANTIPETSIVDGNARHPLLFPPLPRQARRKCLIRPQVIPEHPVACRRPQRVQAAIHRPADGQTRWNRDDRPSDSIDAKPNRKGKTGMEQRIVGFHMDDEHHWVADLQCGHTRHVRHDPPWQMRPWVITPEGRESRLGAVLQCKECDRRRQGTAGPI
jgi:hypothetical protein